MEYLKLQERKDILRLGFKDSEGHILKDKNGKELCLEFDLGDVELPLRYSRCVELMREASKKLKMQLQIINKKQDRKGKGVLTINEIEKVKALKQFYKDSEYAMDLFLGPGGTKKFLNGKNPYFEMWDDISEAIKPYLPKLKLTVEDMENRIKNKYGVSESEVLGDV